METEMKSNIDVEASGASPDVPKLRLDWEGVTVVKHVQVGNIFRPKVVEKTILTNISGSAEPGEVLAIMGPSGGGKTSLLNCLSKRAKITSGTLTLNGKKLPRNFNKLSAYVMQDDRLFEVLTPRELFQFSANLRLPKTTTPAEKKRAVDVVIEKLKMSNCADTRVGGALMRGLSGGERKRTAIGYELITNPSLLFLDEPTSGLDSFTAFSLIQTLKALAQEGHIIICTIHQPSSEIFNLFDKLNLLVRGQVAYNGPASESIGFFAGLGHPCPTYTNPSDFFMALLQTQSEEDRQRTQLFVEASKKVQKDPSKGDGSEHPAFDEDVHASERPAFFIQFRELAKRSWVTTIRNPLIFKARMGQTLLIALMEGLIYYDLSHNQVGVKDRTGALFFVSMSQIMSSLNSVLLTFPLERALLIREQTNGMYGVTSYFLGKTVSGLPMDIFFPTLFSLIVYWMVGFTNEVDRFFLFLLTTISLSLTAGSMGIWLGSMLPNAEMAVSISPLLIIPFMLFAGFLVDLASIPSWLSWIQYLSIFKWALQAFISNEFHDYPYTCTDNELVYATVGNTTIEVCPITNGDQVLATWGFSFPDDYWIAIGVILSLLVGFRILAYIFLLWQTNRSLKKDQ